MYTSTFQIHTCGQRGNFQRIKTNSKLKNIAVKVKNSICGLNIRIDIGEERISELEDRSVKIYI